MAIILTHRTTTAFSRQFAECTKEGIPVRQTYSGILNGSLIDCIESLDTPGSLQLFKCGLFGGICSSSNSACKELRSIPTKQK